jgi:3-oxoacyl-[acyl-carrier-protein] synthase-1/3-oxoacyl-[acyl-carrier-protein] synthase II
LRDVAVIAYGAVSAFGEGAAATSAGEVGLPARVAIARDEELAAAGLARPFAARAWPPGGEGRAAALLERALTLCATDLDASRPAWRAGRVGLVVGTSSGGMRAAERAFAEIARGQVVADRRALAYWGPLARAAEVLGVPVDPSVLVLGACASATIAIGLGARWLDADACDVVIAGGFDEVTVFVAAGFEVLRATTASPPPRPFRAGRDGMALGEGAAVVALARAGGGAARAFVAGFAASSDAVHLTAPDREGAGLARAAASALKEAGTQEVDLVSAHATATPFNDAAEARAISSALGEAAARTPVHPLKAQLGHTLGAAGALEVLSGIDAMTRGILPAAAGEGAVDEAARVRLLDRAEQGAPRRLLKLSSAFGGANAALVVTLRDEGVSRPQRRPVFVHAAVHVTRETPIEELAVLTRMSVDRLGRVDGLVLRVLAAAAQLQAKEGPLAGAGIVVGTAMGPVETNALFAAHLRARGVRAAEPRRFPYTSPNAAAGECSIAFGLTGPGLSVGGGLHAGLEALATAAALVEAGDADRMVVVAADEAGPATRALAGDVLRAGAVAILLGAGDERRSRARIGRVSLRRGGAVTEAEGAGHLALVPLASPGLPPELRSSSPPDVTGRVELLAAGG